MSHVTSPQRDEEAHVPHLDLEKSTNRSTEIGAFFPDG
jgi:hypothetical protein